MENQAHGVGQEREREGWGAREMFKMYKKMNTDTGDYLYRMIPKD